MKKNTFLYILGGGLFDYEFFVRNVALWVLTISMLFVFIGNRYSCIMKVKQIDALQEELKEIRYESIDISNELTTKTRRSQVEQIIKQKGLDIAISHEPPYVLTE